MIYNYQQRCQHCGKDFLQTEDKKKKKNKLANLKKKIELDALEFIKNKIAVFQKP